MDENTTLEALRRMLEERKMRIITLVSASRTHYVATLFEEHAQGGRHFIGEGVSPWGAIGAAIEKRDNWRA